MSLYIIASTKSIQNDTAAATSDVNTRIAFDATIAGYLAGLNSTGANNSIFGYTAGYNTTTGSSNTFIGHVSGYTYTVGNVSTFVGAGAGCGNLDGIDNVFLGYRAGFRNLSGKQNVFLGNYSGQLFWVTETCISAATIRPMRPSMLPRQTTRRLVHSLQQQGMRITFLVTAI